MTGYDDEMIEAQAYGPDDDRPADDDMPLEHDPAAERMAAHLDAVDAAFDWTPGGDGDMTPAVDPIVMMLAGTWHGDEDSGDEDSGDEDSEPTDEEWYQELESGYWKDVMGR